MATERDPYCEKALEYYRGKLLENHDPWVRQMAVYMDLPDKHPIVAGIARRMRATDQLAAVETEPDVIVAAC